MVFYHSIQVNTVLSFRFFRLARSLKNGRGIFYPSGCLLVRLNFANVVLCGVVAGGGWFGRASILRYSFIISVFY